jgi:hypothetical protein
MNIFIYFSTYIIFAGFLYYFNLIKYNPFLWLVFALFVSICISIYSINDNNFYTIIKYLLFNSPKLLLVLIIDKNNLFNGFIFYSSLFFIYLILIDYNLYDIYYNKTMLKVINNEY